MKNTDKKCRKTWEEKREELIEKNREQAEANRQKISEYEKNIEMNIIKKKEIKKFLKLKHF